MTSHTMRRLFSFLCAAGVLLTLSVGWASAAGYAFCGPDPVAAGDIISFSAGPGFDGGEYLVNQQGAADLFRTFCIQEEEYMAFAPSASFLIAGIGTNVQLGNKPLGSATAYLYHQFRHGGLVGYVQGSRTSADALQLALWNLQGERNVPAPNAQAVFWINQARAAVASGAWTGTGDVAVLNLLWETGWERYPGLHEVRYHGNAQDVLCIVPVPEPSFLQMGCLALLGAGGMRLSSRRSRAGRC